MATEFKTGDIVTLCTGGPLMVVDQWGRDNGGVQCFWFVGDELKDMTFDGRCLRLVASSVANPEQGEAA